ncbi:helix-turn-helix transcriptional regulator [Pseudocitrobacter vendiensis]|uniref:Helix-turn-helix domain-containing protein n=1 Tax=Pseudocitrobacter vendiensis TaxID=2488306 RepID=A0ABM9F8P2_9ENTR|nr:LuxR C-terminal-related transcriptional regulator [Pseudocitrobacter vendiensis]CAH6637201.1 Helix-turn-helix domain-containing protein [Pseudocitrobacter vendiensis]
MEVTCIGCGINCSHLPDMCKYKLRCSFKRLVIWPERNHYFKIAIHNIFIEKVTCCFIDGVIVVDFSCINITHYLDEIWINDLEKIGLKIIIVAEASMVALANYWLNRSESILSIIEVDDGINTIILRFRKLLEGRWIPGRKHPVFSLKEMTTLKLLLQGYSTRDIAKKLSCTVRNVYDSRYSLRRKIGGLNNFKDLFTIINIQ